MHSCWVCAKNNITQTKISFIISDRAALIGITPGDCFNPWNGNTILHSIANSVDTPAVVRARKKKKLPSWTDLFHRVLDLVKGRMLGGSGGSIPLVDAQNKEGNTALHCAAQHNHDVICIALVMAGKGGFPPR